MGVGNEELVNPIVFFGGCRLFATPASFLSTVFAQRLALDVTAVTECDDHVGRCDQILRAQVERTVFHKAASGTELSLAKLLFDRCQFIANDGGDALGLAQNIEQVFDLAHHLFVFSNDLVLLQARQALQAHLQNLVRLRVTQTVQAIAAHADRFVQPVGAVIISIDHATVGTRTSQHFAHQLAVPRLGHQLGLGDRRCGRIADDADELVNICQRHRQALEHMTAFARLAQGKDGTARNDLAPMLQEDLYQVFQIAQLWLAVDQSHHVDTKRVLQLGLLVQVVQHHLGHFAALQLNHQAHA